MGVLLAVVPSSVSACADDPQQARTECKPKQKSKEECDKLNDDVQAAKSQTYQLGRCRAGMSGFELRLRELAWLREAVARARRDVSCWLGGDASHQQAQAQAWQNVANCQALIWSGLP
jgi:hypothetical protein